MVAWANQDLDAMIHVNMQWLQSECEIEYYSVGYGRLEEETVNCFPGPLLPLSFVRYTPKTPVFGDLFRSTPTSTLLV